MSKRAMFIQKCIELHGLPYLWGGKGFPSEPYAGRDCSGFVTERAWAVGCPDKRADFNCAKLWGTLPNINANALVPGDLVMWGDDSGNAHHVMVHLGIEDLVIGSAGGDHTTTTAVMAAQQKARVQVWNSLPNVAGFRLLGYCSFNWLDQ